MAQPTLEMHKRRFELEIEDIPALVQEAQRHATGAAIHDINTLSAWLTGTAKELKLRILNGPELRLLVTTEKVITKKLQLRMLIAGISPNEALRRAPTEGRPIYTYKQIEEMLQKEHIGGSNA